MIKLVVEPKEKRSYVIDGTDFIMITNRITKNKLSQIFLNYLGKEIELFFQEEPYVNDKEFRINDTLPFSFKGTVLIAVNKSQFNGEKECEEFAKDLIKNIHYF